MEILQLYSSSITTKLWGLSCGEEEDTDIILLHVDPPSVVVYIDAECGARCDDGGEEGEDQQHAAGTGSGAGVGVVGVVCWTVGRRVRKGWEDWGAGAWPDMTSVAGTGHRHNTRLISDLLREILRLLPTTCTAPCIVRATFIIHNPTPQMTMFRHR